MAGGLPPQIPPPSIPGLTQGPPGMGGGAPEGSTMMPADMLGSALSRLKNRSGSASEIMRQVVTMLETVASVDTSLKDRVGAALALLRGPKKPGGNPNSSSDKD